MKMLRLIALLAWFGFALVGSKASRFSSVSRGEGSDSGGGGSERNKGHSNSRPEYLPNLSRLFDSRNASHPSANDSVLARDGAYSRRAHQYSLTTGGISRRPSGPKTRGSHPHCLHPSKDHKRDQRTGGTVVVQDDYYDGEVWIPEDEMRAQEPLPDSHQKPSEGEKIKEAEGFSPEKIASLSRQEIKGGGRNEGPDRASSSSVAGKSAEITDDTDHAIDGEGNNLPGGDWDRGRGKTHLVVWEGWPEEATTDSSEPILELELLLQQPAGGPHQSSAQERPLEVPPCQSSGASSCSDSVDEGSSEGEERPPLPSLPGMTPLQLAASVITSRKVESLSPSLLEDGSGVSALPRPLTLDNATCPEILMWTPLIVEPAVIVQVVSHDFISVEKNFIILMEKNSGVTRESILLLCLDSLTVRTFTNLGVRCAPVIGVMDHRMIYKMRVKVLGCLLEAGRDVLLSDSDALWLKDPFEDMRQHDIVRNDIVTQRGSYPLALSQKWGFTMCMGFAFFRSGTEGMTEFQRVFMETLLHTGDDQVGVNHAAAKLGMLWNRHESDMRYFHSTSIASGVVRQLPGNFSVVLLPHRRYIRECHKTNISEETVVAHCLTTKKAGDKLSWMKTMGLWLVDMEPLSGLVSRESTPKVLSVSSVEDQENDGL